MTSDRSLSMGDLLESLSEEFPDITASKVRYLESEGLIEPERTPRGSRRFAPEDVQRLRRILRLQRDEYLPLKVIREGLDTTVPAPGGEPQETSPQRLRRGRPRAMSPAEICERSGIDRATFDDLEKFGLVSSRDTDALAICTVVHRLEEFGIEPRHLRSSRVAADREIGLVEQALAPRRGSSGADPALEGEARARLLALLIDLHVALVRAGLPR
ncbi:MAG: transcriptional regulator FtsR [Candidatus Nanopelagicales bacterium]